MKYMGRGWTDGQKKAASERMKARWAAKHRQSDGWKVFAGPVTIDMPDPKKDFSAIEVIEKSAPKARPPEVQAVIDSMDPVRKARLQAVQARQWGHDAASDRATREALERHEAQKIAIQTTTAATGVIPEPSAPGAIGQVVVPPRPGSREVNLIVKNDGTMVSINGNCVCGVPKRVWHRICLRGS